MTLCKSLIESVMNRGAAAVHLPWPADALGPYGFGNTQYSDQKADEYVAGALELNADMVIGGVVPGRAYRGESSELSPCIVVTVMNRHCAARTTSGAVPDIGRIRHAWFDGPRAH